MTAVGWTGDGSVVADRHEQSDDAWMRDYERRRRAERVQPLNRVAAADILSQNRRLGDAFMTSAVNSEARRRGPGYGSRPRVSAEDAALVRCYYRDHPEELAVVARAQARSSASAARRGRPAEGCPPELTRRAGRCGCSSCEFNHREAVGAVFRGSIRVGGFLRVCPLEDIRIVRSADGGDGRTVDAYATVFDQPAEIRDHEGHYLEIIDPEAFSGRLAELHRSGLGQVKVLYNHGMNLDGSVSERFGLPIGTPVDIRADGRGLLTRTRYSRSALADEVLEAIRAGAITSQSFTGGIEQSSPALRRGARYGPDRAGNLTTVRRLQLGLREYGPVLFPAYKGAAIVGVRGLAGAL